MRPSGNRSRSFWAAVYVALVAASAMGCLSGCRKEPVRPQVTIRAKRWFVELAVTPQQRVVGLSGRRDLADDAGMLFVFSDSAVRQFCMRGCHIPLDIAFLDEHRRVVHIATMAVEADRAGRVPYSSQRPAKYALEVAAGGLAAAGIQVGDQAFFTGDIPR